MPSSCQVPSKDPINKPILLSHYSARNAKYFQYWTSDARTASRFFPSRFVTKCPRCPPDKFVFRERTFLLQYIYYTASLPLLPIIKLSAHNDIDQFFPANTDIYRSFLSIMQKYPPTPKSISPAKNRATYDTTFSRIRLFFLFLLFMCFLLVLYAGMILASNLSPKRFRLRYAVSSVSTASSSSSFISLFRQ